MNQIKTEYLYQFDSLVKVVQTQSIWDRHFLSEELNYPGKDIDPNYEFTPLATITDRNGKHLGMYPVFLTALAAPFLVLLGTKFISVSLLLLTILMLFYIQRRWELDIKSVAMLFFCTPFAFYWIDFSENVYFVLLGALGFTLYFRNPKSDFKLYTMSGFFLGLAICFRLEVLFFTFSLVASGLLVNGITNKQEIQKNTVVCFGFCLAFLAFCAFNYWDYGHPLGSRFITLVEDFSPTIFERLNRAFVLMFFGYFKLGIFGFTPLILVVMVYFLWKFKDSQVLQDSKQIVVALLLFIPSISLSAPNDGVFNWGSRFLYLALVPSAVLIDRFIKWKGNWDKKWIRIMVYTLSFYSLLASFAGLYWFKNITKLQKSFQSFYYETNADIYLFHELGLYYNNGTNVLDKKVFLIKSPGEKLDKFIQAAKEKAKGQKIAFFELTIEPWVKTDDKYYNTGFLFDKEREEYVNKLNQNFKIMEIKKEQKKIISHIFYVE
ncbi:MAG: hypothetical protein H7A23_22355 [Leptospiraceae bacterium]|nr:hypothetical protein [Leptospiraceae bacterium]MCP5497305.1 hypothetical protein [Leptospiraceae bacterium]